jgi:hypothetical protein
MVTHQRQERAEHVPAYGSIRLVKDRPCRQQRFCMALMGLIYRDELFPRQAYKLTFERLIEQLPERAACKTTVELLVLAHDRGCEADLAQVLEEDLAAGRLPDLAALRRRFSADPAALPEVVVRLAPLSDYEALLTSALGEAA